MHTCSLMRLRVVAKSAKDMKKSSSGKSKSTLRPFPFAESGPVSEVQSFSGTHYAHALKYSVTFLRNFSPIGTRAEKSV